MRFNPVFVFFVKERGLFWWSAKQASNNVVAQLEKLATLENAYPVFLYSTSMTAI